VISNTGFDRIVVSGITYPIGFSGNWSGTLAPGASQSVPVAFKPTALQSYSGNIVVASDASNGVGTIALSGQGERSVGLSGNLSFGNNNTVNASVQRTLTIRNTGSMTLTVSGITYPSGFSGNWSGTIAAGASQNVTVTFKPTELIPYSGNISVASTATTGSGVMAVSGSVTGAFTSSIVGPDEENDWEKISIFGYNDTLYFNARPTTEELAGFSNMVISVDGEQRASVTYLDKRNGSSFGYMKEGSTKILRGVFKDGYVYLQSAQ
jgi:hypothetical protein